MAWIDCIKTKTIVACTKLLTIGTIDYINSNIAIFVENVTTGRIERVLGTSNAFGVVDLDMTKPTADYYSPNQSYNLSITLRDVNATEKLKITIGGQRSDCFELTFDKAYSGSTVRSFDSQVLQLDESFTFVVPLHHFDSVRGVQADDSSVTDVHEWYNLGSGNNGFQITLAKRLTIDLASLSNQQTIDGDGTENLLVSSSTQDLSANYFSLECVVNPALTDGNVHAIWSKGELLAPLDSSVSISVWFQRIGLEDFFGIDIFDGTSLTEYFTIPITIQGVWATYKIEFKDGEVFLFQNGNQIQSQESLSGSAPTQVIPQFIDDQYLFSLLDKTVELDAIINCRLMKLYTSEPSAVQKQLDTLEMLATI